MRSLIFNVFFVAATFFYALICVVLSLLPGRALMMARMCIRDSTKAMATGL